MPISSRIETKRISQDEFRLIACEVMRHAIDIQNEFGRFFDELVYKRELAYRMSGVSLEVAIDVTHGDFSKTYFADVLVNDGGLFEIKVADILHPRHRGQILNYLLMLDLAHGKVVNMRPERVEHEFVNCPARLSELRKPVVIDEGWDSGIEGSEKLRDILMPLVHDWGAGLEIALYEEAITHFLGGTDKVLVPVPVLSKNRHLSDQRMRLVARGTAFKITALPGRLDEFASHARRLLEHTPLSAIHWINITQSEIRLVTLSRPRLCLKRGLTLSGEPRKIWKIVSPPKGQTPFQTEPS